MFAGLDKTTGRIINFDAEIDETVQFGSLQVTPRVCNTRPQIEAPQTTGFVEVDEQVGAADQKPSGKGDGKSETKRIFSGWMFAASPGLHGVEHPVYDVWLVDCKGGKEVAAQPAAGAGPAVVEPADEKKKSKRSRKVEPAAPAPIEAQPIGPADQPDAAAPDAQPAPGDAPPAPEQPKKKKKKKPKPPPAAAAPAAAPADTPLLPF